MDVITLASRKGGAGKSTLTAQLAAQAQVAGKRVLVIDADPQGSLKLWHSRRAARRLKLVTPERGIDRAMAFAMIEGSDTCSSTPRRPCGWWCRRRSAPPRWC